MEGKVMSEQNRKPSRRNNKKSQPRQDWKPHWLPDSIYRLWCVVFSVFKVAAAAVITVALVVVVMLMTIFLVVVVVAVVLDIVYTSY
jgi:hypothetical protein